MYHANTVHYVENGPRLFYVLDNFSCLVLIFTINYSVISLSLRKCRWSSPTSPLPTPSIQQRPIPRPASPCPRQPATVISAVAAIPHPSRRRSPRTGMSFIPPCLRRRCCTYISRRPVASPCFRTLPRGAAHSRRPVAGLCFRTLRRGSAPVSAAALWPALVSGLCLEELLLHM